MKRKDISKELYEFDSQYRLHGVKLVGVDEAGRGPLAGPVIVAAVCLDPFLPIEGLNDSKKLTAKRRSKLYKEITDSCIGFGLGISNHDVIDDIDIYQATIRAMHQAIDQLEKKIGKLDIILVDHVCLSLDNAIGITNGDNISASIAAASIIAKETRDEMMKRYSDLYPDYGFERHKGYGTKLHLEALEKYGPCPIHRRTFSRVC